MNKFNLNWHSGTKLSKVGHPRASKVKFRKKINIESMASDSKLKKKPARLGINWREISTSLSLPNVASWLDGYSRAEVTNVCRVAAMSRRLAGLKPSEIRSRGREELDVPFTMDDFKEAVEKCNKSVSSEDLEKYKAWMEEFGST